MVEQGTEGGLFEEVRREESLSTRVAAQLEKLIQDNRLKPGDRLPSERILAEQLGVSRTVVREAVRTLVARRLLEVRSGSGTVVGSLEPGVMAEFMSSMLDLSLRSGKLGHDKVVEVRRMLEVEIAGFAARRRTEEDIMELEEILLRAQSDLGDPEVFVETDISFHECLARTSHNALFFVLLRSITDVLIEGRQLALEVPGTAERAQEYHRSIFERVRAGEVDGAREAMDRHMDEAGDTMKKALDRYHTE